MEDSASSTVPPATGEVVVADEADLEPFSPEGSTCCQSRTSTTGSDSGEEYKQEEEAEDIVKIFTEEKERNETHSYSQNPAKNTGHHSRPHAQFLADSLSSKKLLTKAQMEHEKKMQVQVEAMVFQAISLNKTAYDLNLNCQCVLNSQAVHFSNR